MKKKNLLTKITNIVLGMVLASVLIILADANINHFTAYLDSDCAAEVEMAKLLFDNSFKQPTSWVSSTHGYTIMSSNFAALFYVITHNINLSMGLACILLYILVTLLGFAFYKKIGFNSSEALIGVLLPFIVSLNIQQVLKVIALYAAHYECYIAVLFAILIIYANGLKRNTFKWLEVSISVILVILSGIQGMQSIMIVWAPLLGAELVRTFVRLVHKERCFSNGNILKKNYALIWSAACFVGCYVITKITGAFGSTTRNIRHAAEKFFEEVVPDVANLIAIDNRWALTLPVIVIALFGILLLIYSCFIVNKEDENKNDSDQMWALAPIVIGFIVPVVGATFTTMESAGRYYVMLVYALAVGYIFICRQLRGRGIRYLLCLVVVILGMISAVNMRNNLIIADSSSISNENQAAQWMRDNGYNKGYSTWDYSARITVFSNDSVLVAPLADMEELEGCRWLTDYTWYPPYEDSDKTVVYIVSDANTDDFNKFIEDTQPVIINKIDFGYLHLYVTDRDYSYWNED